jgi:hypothetical protein
MMILTMMQWRYQSQQIITKNKRQFVRGIFTGFVLYVIIIVVQYNKLVAPEASDVLFVIMRCLEGTFMDITSTFV